MLEFLGLTVDVFLLLVDLLGWMLEWFAHRRSKLNRVARKEAKRRGQPVPKRNGWGVFSLVFGLFMVAFTIVLLAWFIWGLSVS